MLSIEQVHPSRRLNEARLEQVISRVIEQEGGELRHLTVVLAGHPLVRRLNREYLDHDYETDVLSFPLTEEAGVVDGEVYVDLDTAADRHEEFDASFQEEALRYVVHGVLHLLGYDDATPDGRATMRRREDEYLQQ